MSLSKHQVVSVYEDPIKQRVREGNAEIVAVGKEVVPGVHLCDVHFLGDAPGVTVKRLVNEVACECSQQAGDNPNCPIHTVRIGSDLATVIATRWGD